MDQEEPKKPFITKRYGVHGGIIYKTPDGENCLEKTVEYSLIGGKIGVGLAIFDVMLLSKPSTVLGALGRGVAVAGPGAAGFATFAATSCLLGGIRKENDFFNHFMGGLAGGAVWNIRNGTKKALGFGLLVACVVGMMKQAKDEGKDLLPATIHPDYYYNRERWMLPPPEKRSKPPENY